MTSVQLSAGCEGKEILVRSLHLVFERQSGKLYTFDSNIKITPAEEAKVVARYGPRGVETDQKKLTRVQVIDWPF